MAVSIGTAICFLANLREFKLTHYLRFVKNDPGAPVAGASSHTKS
jgi:hypothetical protein